MYPLYDMAQMRVMKVNGAGPHYPTGVVLGHGLAARQSSPVQQQNGTFSATEANSVFLENDGTSTPIYSAFIHRIVCYEAPAAVEQYKLHVPIRAGAGTPSNAIAVHLPEFLAAGYVDLGYMMVGGFDVRGVQNSDGSYQLIYELIPLGRSQSRPAL